MLYMNPDRLDMAQSKCRKVVKKWLAQANIDGVTQMLRKQLSNILQFSLLVLVLRTILIMLLWWKKWPLVKKWADSWHTKNQKTQHLYRRHYLPLSFHPPTIHLPFRVLPRKWRMMVHMVNSFSFKAEIDKIFLPPNASLFIYDAKSMYTSIDTEECISSISEFLKRPSTYTWNSNTTPL